MYNSSPTDLEFMPLTKKIPRLLNATPPPKFAEEIVRGFFVGFFLFSEYRFGICGMIFFF
jgi:hypothetical protein